LAFLKIQNVRFAVESSEKYLRKIILADVRLEGMSKLFKFKMDFMGETYIFKGKVVERYDYD